MFVRIAYFPVALQTMNLMDVCPRRIGEHTSPVISAGRALGMTAFVSGCSVIAAEPSTAAITIAKRLYVPAGGIATKSKTQTIMTISAKPRFDIVATANDARSIPSVTANSGRT